MDTPLHYPLDFFVVFYAVQTRTNGRTHFPGCAVSGVAMGQGFPWMKSNLLCRYQCRHRADSLDVQESPGEPQKFLTLVGKCQAPAPATVW